ncbi:MAG: GntR family transcriptional regulator [Lachnospiraceae bacterium]|nr:GntR family transcriptional regulator [Lachnospiraceae bacterium]
MPWKLSADKPIYLQLMDHIKADVVAGNYKPGDKIPSVRELAAAAGVNPNTMQKALSELEREGLLFSERTSGRFVSDDPARIEQTKVTQAKELTHDYLGRMKQLGFERDAVTEFILQNNEE